MSRIDAVSPFGKIKGISKYPEWHAWQGVQVEDRPSYQLRHTFASPCLENGVTPGWLANELGHSTLQTTFKHYARFIKDTSRENEARLEHLLTPKSHFEKKA